MWNIVASIQQTLDEAAGLNNNGRPPVESPETTERAAGVGSNASNADPIIDVTAVGEGAGGRGEADKGDTSPPAVDQWGFVDDHDSPLTSPKGEELSENPSTLGEGPARLDAGQDVELMELRTRVQAAELEAESNAKEIAKLRRERDALSKSLAVAQDKIRECDAEQQAQRKVDPAGGALVEALKREGEQLSAKLGAERERVKSLNKEKKALDDIVLELQETIRDYSTKETQWNEESAAQRLQETLLRARISELETLSMKQANEMGRLSCELSDAVARLTATEALRQSEAAETSRDAEQVRKNLEEKIASLETDMNHLRSVNKRQIIEYDTRNASLQRELNEALQRAHIAEGKLLDSHYEASGSLQELAAQLDDSVQAQQRLQVQLRAKVAECSALASRAKASDDECQRRVDEWSHKHAAVQQENHRLSVECDKKDAALAKEHLRNQTMSSLVEALRRERDDLQAALSRFPPSPPMPAVSAAIVSPSKEATRVGPSPSPTAAEVEYQSRQSAGSLTRVDRELARLTRELRRLRGVEADAERYKAQLDQLMPQHDLILQMYGQLQEELVDVKADLSEAKGIYQHQIAELGAIIERMQHQRENPTDDNVALV